MNSQKIAFPSSIDGIHGDLSLHFGHTPAFTVIEYDTDTFQVKSIEILQNAPHQHGKCMRPVMLLKNAGVDTIVVGLIGRPPLSGFSQVGIKILKGKEGKIKENFQAFQQQQLSEYNYDHICDGGNC